MTEARKWNPQISMWYLLVAAIVILFDFTTKTLVAGSTRFSTLFSGGIR
jgi:hypothetical protein